MVRPALELAALSTGLNSRPVKVKLLKKLKSLNLVCEKNKL